MNTKAPSDTKSVPSKDKVTTNCLLETRFIAAIDTPAIPDTDTCDTLTDDAYVPESNTNDTPRPSSSDSLNPTADNNGRPLNTSCTCCASNT